MIQPTPMFEGKDKNGTTHYGKRIISNGKVFIQKWKVSKQIIVEVIPSTVKEIEL
jgi:hypothetical protein